MGLYDGLCYTLPPYGTSLAARTLGHYNRVSSLRLFPFLSPWPPNHQALWSLAKVGTYYVCEIRGPHI